MCIIYIILFFFRAFCAFCFYIVLFCEKALAAGICKKVVARVQQPEKQTGILLYGDVPEERLAEVEKRMREEIGFKDVVRCAIGPSVLSNTGPLAIAVAYYGAPRE